MSLDDTIQEAQAITSEAVGDRAHYPTSCRLVVDDQDMVRVFAVLIDSAEIEALHDMLASWPQNGWGSRRLTDPDRYCVTVSFSTPLAKDDWRLKALREMARVFFTIEEHLEFPFDATARLGETMDLDDPEVYQVLRQMAERLDIEADESEAEAQSATENGNVDLTVDSYVIMDVLICHDPRASLEVKGFYYYLCAQAFWPRDMLWPSITKMAKDNKIGRTKVTKLIQELVDLGALQCSHGTGRGHNIYKLVHRRKVKELCDQNTHLKIRKRDAAKKEKERQRR